MGLTLLRKYSNTFYKDKSASDTAQVAAAGATVMVYKQGATVTSGQTVTTAGGGVAVSVRSTGGIVLTDTVQLGTDSTKQMTVEEITSDTSMKLRSTIGSSITVSADQRLVPYSSQPTLYSESTGIATTPNPTTADSTGYAKFYMNEMFFDIIVSGSGITSTLYIDNESGHTITRRGYYNVKDFASVADALSAIPAGARLYFPDTTNGYVPPTAAGWTLSKSVEIFGDGMGGGEGDCFRYFNWSGAGNKDSTVFNIKASNVYLHDIKISNAQGVVSALGTGCGVLFDDTTVISQFMMERCYILYAGNSGIRFAGNNYGIEMMFKDCRIYGCRGPGIYLNLCNVVKFINVISSVCRGDKVSGVGGSSFGFVGCAELSLDTCTAESSGQSLSHASYDGYVVLENCHNAQINSVHIEDQGEAAIRNGIILNACKSATVQSCGIGFPAGAGSATSIGIHILNNSKGNMILTNEFGNLNSAVKIDSAANDFGNIVMPQEINASDASTPGKIVLPAGGRNFAFYNNLTAGLGDNKGVGMLLPSMPTVAAIDSSVVQEGLVVYDSTAGKLKVYASSGGVGWKDLH